MKKWMILDRDGVINEDSDLFIKSPNEWHAIPGSLEAMAKLNQAGYCIAICSNQSGIARGLLSLQTLSDIHDKLNTELGKAGGKVDALYYCPHDPDDSCDCRKPLAGLFIRFAKEHDVDLKNIYAVGDSVRDLQAAQSCGANAILLKTGKGKRSLKALSLLDKDDSLKSVPVFDNLSTFVDAFLSKPKHYIN